MGRRRTRTRDGSVRMRDASAEWLACTMAGLCVEGWHNASSAVPSLGFLFELSLSLLLQSLFRFLVHKTEFEGKSRV